MKTSEQILKDIPWPVYGELYQLADEFRKAAPWLWVEDIDIVHLKDPESGAEYFATLPGQEGRFEGLALHEGESGLALLSGLLKKEISAKDRDTFFRQKGLTMNFQKRSAMDALNREILARLPVCRDHPDEPVVPVFFSFTPWQVPWFLDERQARVMIMGIRRMMEFACMAEMSPEWLDVERVSKTGFHVFSPSGKGGQIWDSRWVDFYDHKLISRDFLPDDFREELLRLPLHPDVNWEAHLFCLPSPLDDGEVQYYPRCTMVVDAESGQMYHSGMDDVRQGWGDIMVKRLLQAIRAMSLRPQEIFFQDVQLMRLLQPLLLALNIKSSHRPGLEMLSIVRADFEREFFANHSNQLKS